MASTTAHVDSLSVEDKLKFAIINGEKSVGEGAQKKSLEQLLEDALVGPGGNAASLVADLDARLPAAGARDDGDPRAAG